MRKVILIASLMMSGCLFRPVGGIRTTNGGEIWVGDDAIANAVGVIVDDAIRDPRPNSPWCADDDGQSPHTCPGKGAEAPR
jgi:hypothetical protein